MRLLSISVERSTRPTATGMQSSHTRALSYVSFVRKNAAFLVYYSLTADLVSMNILNLVQNFIFVSYYIITVHIYINFVCRLSVSLLARSSLLNVLYAENSMRRVSYSSFFMLLRYVSALFKQGRTSNSLLLAVWSTQ
jgi:hypothetical protein